MAIFNLTNPYIESTAVLSDMARYGKEQLHKHVICPLTFVLGYTEQKIFNTYLSYTQILCFSWIINILSLQDTALYGIWACTVHFAQKIIERYKNFTLFDLYNDSETDKYKYLLDILDAVSKDERQRKKTHP